jgi:predicted ATPase
MCEQAGGGVTKERDSLLKAPFLRTLTLDKSQPFDPAAYPFSIKATAAEDFQIEFTTPVTVLVGLNGTGKSTILEAIAALCGFGRQGGNGIT